MYSVFVVFAGGHTIKLATYQYESNARIDAEYHAKYTNLDTVHYEVVYKTEVIGTY